MAFTHGFGGYGESFDIKIIETIQDRKKLSLPDIGKGNIAEEFINTAVEDIGQGGNEFQNGIIFLAFPIADPLPLNAEFIGKCVLREAMGFTDPADVRTDKELAPGIFDRHKASPLSLFYHIIRQKNCRVKYRLGR